MNRTQTLRRATLGAFASLGLIMAVQAQAQTASTSWNFKTPAGSYRSTTTYSGSQQAYDAAVRAKAAELNRGQGFYNERNGQTRSTTSSTTVGGAYRGFGAEYQSTTVPRTRSAAEDALHDHSRTQHLRDLQRSTESRVQLGRSRSGAVHTAQ